jgi:hypothetical protein
MAFAEVSYTLSKLAVAAYNITANTYGTPATLALGQEMDVDSEADNDKLASYGRNIRLLSVIKGGVIKLGTGGISFAGLVIVAGITSAESGSTPNQARKATFPAGGAGLPYFGAIGESPTDDGGIEVVGLQACKLDKYPSRKYDGKTNKFNMTDTDGSFVPVDIAGVAVAMVIRTYETASDWTTPTTGPGFLAFFTSP